MQNHLYNNTKHILPYLGFSIVAWLFLFNEPTKGMITQS